MEIREIKINDVEFKENIRQGHLDEQIPELMTSIKDYGLLEPIGVKEEPNNRYTLVWGYRRITACNKLGWKSIPAVIFLKSDDTMTEEEFFLINATENIQRKNNSLLEFGRVCKILRKTMSVSEIASRLSVPHRRVASALNELQRIPKKYQSRVRIMSGGEREKKGDIPLSTASKISRFYGLTKEQKEQVYEQVSLNDLGYYDVYFMISMLKNGYSMQEAKDKLNQYKVFSTKVFANKERLSNEMKKLEIESEGDFFIYSMNRLYGKDFLIKPSQTRKV